jgi:hypothetical protein
MTPKEKAEQLIDSFRIEIISFLGENIKQRNAVKCALIAVKEILDNDLNSEVYSYWEAVEEELFIISNKKEEK